MPPSTVSRDEWICRFILPDEWDEDKQRPTPGAFRASDRQLSVFHQQRVLDAKYSMRDLCIDRLTGAGEAHLQVDTYIELGQGISSQFDPKVYWRPNLVDDPWKTWANAHAQVESQGGNADFPTSYRSLLAENATCVKPTYNP